VLNRHFGADPAIPHFSRRSTRILVAGVSNGGGAALRAAELDADDMIDGVVVSEPQVQPIFTRSFVICQEGRPALIEHSRPILDTMTLLNLYQACASCLAGLPNPKAGSEERCRRLAGWGLLEPSEDAADEIQSLARSARTLLEEHGLLPEQSTVQALSHALGVPLGVAVTFANAYGRFHVTDNLAGYGFAATDAKGVPMPMTALTLASLFAVGRGIPPMPGINVINNRIGLVDAISTPDQNIEGALALRSLYTGADLITGELLAGEALERHRRLRIGIATATATALLRGVPTILVHGRADQVVPPNHSSRAYYGRNQVVESEAGCVRYYEVTHAHHFDSFNSNPLFTEYQLADRHVPLHPYFMQALTVMRRHLTEGAAYPLPPSQVIATVPRAEGGPYLPAIDPEPGGNRILFQDGRLIIPAGAPSRTA
jgi:hydroxybutyrate-dimer hydrolase